MRFHGIVQWQNKNRHFLQKKKKKVIASIIATVKNSEIMNWEWILLEMKIKKLETKLYKNKKWALKWLSSSQQGSYHQIRESISTWPWKLVWSFFIFYLTISYVFSMSLNHTRSSSPLPPLPLYLLFLFITFWNHCFLHVPTYVLATGVWATYQWTHTHKHTTAISCQ